LPLGTTKSNWPMFILVGLLMAAIYFLLFRFLILKLNLKTPGREEDTVTATSETANAEAAASCTARNDSPSALGATIVNALGGKANIENVDNCYTRLRLILKDPTVVDEQTLKQTGSKGIIKSGNNVQVVYGLNVKSVRDQVDQQLGGI
jgi:maltose/glucose PTS system EIICB component